MMKDDFEDYLTGSPWRSHGGVGEFEIVSHWNMDDSNTEDDTDATDDDHDDDDDEDDGTDDY